MVELLLPFTVTVKVPSVAIFEAGLIMLTFTLPELELALLKGTCGEVDAAVLLLGRFLCAFQFDFMG